MTSVAPRGPLVVRREQDSWPGLVQVRFQPAPAGPVRIGDAERDRAVSALGDHYAAGRLNREEFDERVDLAMAARVDGDLDPLFVDLPGARPVSAVVPVPAAEVRRFRPAMFLSTPLLLVVAVVAAVVLHSPWLIWGLFWVFMITGFSRRRGLRPGPDPRGRWSQPL